MSRVGIYFLLLVFTQTLSAKVAPNFRGKTIDGKKAALTDFTKKERGLLVCFWATWCSPCIEEMRKLTAELKARPELNLDVLTINVDASETFAEVKPTVKALGISFPVLVDKGQKIFSKYQSEQTLPYSVLMDADRTILQEFNGLHDDMIPVIEKKIEILKKGKKLEKKTS